MMLVLTRKKNEKIIIDDNIEITVLEMDNGHVQIGIDAPEDIEIYREEIYKKIEKENIEAASKKEIDLNELSGFDLKNND